ncbi:MAG: hypothetical protein GX610_04140 [Rhodococcus sp.]|nr:hypothetical protein [Rhodococcus sp. (in: high G+C Gram-positive bacteria)]
MSVEFVVQSLFVVIGAIHVVPGVVAVSVEKTRSAYGLEAGNRDLALLLRHRAVLLVLVGVAMIAGAFVPDLRVPALVVGGASMLTFVAFASRSGVLTPQIRRIVRVDIVGLVVLTAAALLLVVG